MQAQKISASCLKAPEQAIGERLLNIAKDTSRAGLHADAKILEALALSMLGAHAAPFSVHRPREFRKEVLN